MSRSSFVTAKDETEERNEPDEGDPSSKTRACTNDDENVTARQKTREQFGMGNNADRDVGRGIAGSRQTKTRRGGMAEVPTSKTKTLASKFVSYLYESMRWKRRTLNDLLQLTKRC